MSTIPDTASVSVDASRGVITDAGRRLLQLHQASDVGPIRLRRLLNHFGSVEAVFAASRAALQRVEGIGERISDAIFRARDADNLEAEIARAADCGVRIVCLEDPDYPKALLQMPDSPACLYVRGRIEPQDAVAIAIVGTRACSHYGREQAHRFGELLGAAGFTVVSGLARGIDGYAHRGALQAGGRTIAVLGNGLSRIYPAEHTDLAREIEHHGAVISELPIDAAPEAKNFPGRNRIIAGLSLGVLVIEAGVRSGALITARQALDYNREVFALPGRIDRPELTAGVNGFIRDGNAKLVTCLDDILDELAEVGEIMRRGEKADTESSKVAEQSEDMSSPGAGPQYDSEQERLVCEALYGGAEDADALAAASNLEIPRVMTILTALELKGRIKRLPGNRFELRSR
jgi:DNA processing protein